jgi:hypothetical protein
LKNTFGKWSGNAYGHLPLNNANPASPKIIDGPNNDYWDHVDYIINKAEELGLYMTILPSWGNHVTDDGQKIFTTENAFTYGKFVGERYKDKPVIWMMGGDRLTETEEVKNIWREMAKGVTTGVSGLNNQNAVLMSFHPYGGKSSTDTFSQNESWLDMNSQQTGHSAHGTNAAVMITHDYNLSPEKPTWDSEPFYEGWKVTGTDYYRDDYDIRTVIYWGLFAGGHGVTYGSNDVFQFWGPRTSPRLSARDYWFNLLDLPGAVQMTYLKNLMTSRPILSRIPDQDIVSSDEGMTDLHIRATRDSSGKYAFIYIPTKSQSVEVNMGKISGGQVNCWWFNPRDGKVYNQDGSPTQDPFGTYSNSGKRSFTTPNWGPDWVLVLDDKSQAFDQPGKAPSSTPSPFGENILNNPGFEE